MSEKFGDFLDWFIGLRVRTFGVLFFLIVFSGISFSFVTLIGFLVIFPYIGFLAFGLNIIYNFLWTLFSKKELFVSNNVFFLIGMWFIYLLFIWGGVGVASFWMAVFVSFFVMVFGVFIFSFTKRVVFRTSGDDTTALSIVED